MLGLHSAQLCLVDSQFQTALGIFVSVLPFPTSLTGFKAILAPWFLQTLVQAFCQTMYASLQQTQTIQTTNALLAQKQAFSEQKPTLKAAEPNLGQTAL